MSATHAGRLTVRAAWLTPRVLERAAAVVLVAAAVLLVWPARVSITPASRPAPTLATSTSTTVALDLGALVANNPFSPTRRAPTQRFVAPGLEPMADPGMTPTTDAPTPTVHDAPELLGVIRADGTPRALMQVAADSTSRLVAVGARIGRWRVAAIERTQVTLVSPSGTRIVRLARPTPSDSSPPRP